MNPYTLDTNAIRDFMAYHAIKNLKDVAERLSITQGYLTQIMGGERRLNEEMRLRFQIVTRKSQDQLFKPNFEAIAFTHQSFSMAKYYGVMPYVELSPAKEAREGDSRIIAKPLSEDARVKHFRKQWYAKTLDK